MRLIDGDALKEILEDHVRKYGKKQDSDFTQGCCCGLVLAIAELDGIGTEVAGDGLHGFWIDESGEGDSAVCSRCGECFDTTEAETEWRKAFELFKKFYKFCPCCGARMDEEEQDAKTD